MAIFSLYSGKSVLVVDDMTDMRSLLRGQVGSIGIEQIVVARNVKEAAERLGERTFDVILCDYFLGSGTDGQQFLEFLRAEHIIPRSTIFIMITAEKGYESVVTAAECMPDDYLLKPFTAAALKGRLDRLLEKKKRLADVDRLHDQGRWDEVVAACDAIIAARDKYLVDALRIKGGALQSAGRFAEAATFYEGVLEMRQVPWAKLGLARALRSQGKDQDASVQLQEVIADSPRYLAAYDALGDIHREKGEHGEALRVLDQACGISPHAITRHRAIAKVAEAGADFGRVQQAMDTVLKKTRNTPLRQVADYATLGNALTELGEVDKALAIIGEAKSSIRNAAAQPALAAVEAIAQHKAGNAELAEAALQRALGAAPGSLPNEAKLAVAKACLVSGRQEEAEKFLKHVLQDNPDRAEVRDDVTRLMRAHGAGDRVESLVTASAEEMIRLNNDAVAIAKSGDLRKAAQMLRDAAEHLPGNAQIVANAALALYLDVLANGLDADKLQAANDFRQALVAKDRSHPKLRDIATAQERIQAKYQRKAAP